MITRFEMVPNPGRWRSGIHARRMTQLTRAVAQPSEICACLAMPSANTVHGEAPHWDCTSRPSPNPNAASPPKSGTTILGRADQLFRARQGVTGILWLSFMVLQRYLRGFAITTDGPNQRARSRPFGLLETCNLWGHVVTP